MKYEIDQSGKIEQKSSRWELKGWTFTNQSVLGPGLYPKHSKKKEKSQIENL